MPHSRKSDGCQTLVRRSFLLLLGIAFFRLLSKFFSISENRIQALRLIQQFTEQYFPELAAILPFPTPSSVPETLSKSPPIPAQNLPSAPQPKPTILEQPLPSAPLPKRSVSRQEGQPVQIRQKTILGIPFYQTMIDLTDSHTFLAIGLANNVKQANNATFSAGDETFENMVKRYPAAVVANGTFFSKDDQKRVMGNMVSGGKFLKYSQWENFGTTLGLNAEHRPEMRTARTEGKPNWQKHWFSLTCGPRLLKQGKIWLAPKSEGFSDPHVLDVGYRTAIGFTADQKQLFLVSFLAAISLQQEAEVMKAMGCYEAMNLDGGASEALAYQGKILIQPGRNLTNVIIVYDKNYPAPPELQSALQRFQTERKG